MSGTPPRKAVAAAPHDDASLPALLARLRDLVHHTRATISVEDAERELKRIEAGNMSKFKAGRAKPNLRDRIIYALTEAEDDDAIATGGGLPPLVAQPIGDAGSSMQPAALVGVPLPEPLATEHAAFTVASTSTTTLATTEPASSESAAAEPATTKPVSTMQPSQWNGTGVPLPKPPLLARFKRLKAQQERRRLQHRPLRRRCQSRRRLHPHHHR